MKPCKFPINRCMHTDPRSLFIIDTLLKLLRHGMPSRQQAVPPCGQAAPGRRPGFTCGVSWRWAATRRPRPGSVLRGGSSSSTLVYRRTYTAWHRVAKATSAVEKLRAPVPETRCSEVTVTTFRAMKHEPTGGEVRGADRRRRNIPDIPAPPAAR